MSVVSVLSPPNFLLTKCTGAVTTAAEVEATFSAVRQLQTVNDKRKAIAPARVIVRCYQRTEDTQLSQSESNAVIASSLADQAHMKR